jgi:cytochrome c nitrite reductase small subunit
MRILRKLTPPEKWKLPVIVIAGIFTGLALFAFKISNAPSYLGDKPETCTNCHIMAPQYATWSHSSHRERAHCNDCHVPHNNLLNKYYFKAKDGLRHATVFTLRNEPQVIFIKEEGREAVHNNCIRCHSALLADNRLIAFNSDLQQFRTERNCQDCHRETPHGRVNSLSSVPWARVPLPGSAVPDWLDRFMRKGD